jgi:hypothetical protein
LVPGRIPDEFDVGFFDFVEGEEFALDIGGDLAAHMAPGRGEGHFDIDGGTGDGDVVDEAEVHDVEGNFGVVTVAELVPDGLFDDRGGRGGRDGGCVGGAGCGWVVVHRLIGRVLRYLSTARQEPRPTI